MAAFEWDPRKAASNVRKHGVQFADAVIALEDEHGVTMREDSIDEERWVTIGADGLARLLTVVYAWRGDIIRIISARQATPREQHQYLEKT